MKTKVAMQSLVTSVASAFLVLLAMFGASVEANGNSSSKVYCKQGDTCWPTTAELRALADALDPSNKRQLVWEGDSSPRPCAVPIYSPGDQPLYTYGNEGLKPLYTNATSLESCFSTPTESRPVCITSTRNTPYNDWQPAIVVWPVTAAHVQISVQFAVKHKLCISVLGTGHDFLNRHSCNNGILIRTTLLKSITWNSDKTAVQVGAGVTFSEIAQAAGTVNRLVAQGWGITVGVLGWSIGGGHGPFANALGLGTDNILGAEVVTSNGTAITCSETKNADLWWALRGGGGSTWGVITSLTLTAHPFPDDGLTQGDVVYNGTMCHNGLKQLDTAIDAYLNWTLRIGTEFSGLAYFTPTASSDAATCGATWEILIIYDFLGKKDDAGPTWMNLTSSIPSTPIAENIYEYTSQWERAEAYPLEYIIPVAQLSPVGVLPGGLPSVLLSRDTVMSGDVASLIKESLGKCSTLKECKAQQLFHDISGNVGSPKDPNVSISPSFRNAMFHFVFNQWDQDTTSKYYALGNASYFSESAYTMSGDSWKSRYWGINYDKLLAVKRKYDPQNIFWCRNCVGSDL